jgi:hypothetical protein
LVELRACTITVCEDYFSLFHISNFEPWLPELFKQEFQTVIGPCQFNSRADQYFGSLKDYIVFNRGEI